MKNSVRVFGHVGTDLEIKTLENRSKVLNFQVGINEDYKDKASGEKVEKTTWVNMVMWNKTAELFASMCKKGSYVSVEGKLSTRDYESEEKGKVYITEVLAKEFLNLDKKGKED